MGTKIMFVVGDDIGKELDKLKRDEFYNKSHAEMYRYLLKLGIEKAKETK